MLFDLGSRPGENFVNGPTLRIVSRFHLGGDLMVRVTVKFMSVARQHAGTGGVEFVSSERKLGDVLKEIVATYGISDIILTANGEIRPWARVLVNGRSHQFVGGMDLVLSDGDRIALIYPYTENF